MKFLKIFLNLNPLIINVWPSLETGLETEAWRLSEIWEQRSDDRGLKTEIRRLRSGDRGLKTDAWRQIPGERPRDRDLETGAQRPTPNEGDLETKTWSQTARHCHQLFRTKFRETRLRVQITGSDHYKVPLKGQKVGSSFG